MSRSIHIIFALVFAHIGHLYSQVVPWDLQKDLQGDWKFRIGDQKNWADPALDDSQWDEVQVPAPWETQGFHAYDGYAWYRKTFSVDAETTENKLYLSLGYIDDVDQVYINGELIGFSGSFPPYYQTAYNAYRRYPIPAGLLQPGKKNVIAIRVYDARVDGGIITGLVGLVSNPDFNKLDLDLSGIWEFGLGDNMAWKDNATSSANWEKIMVPLFWEKQGFVNYDGYAWYRKAFFLPENLRSQDLILFLGKIDDYDQAFINGQLIGSTGFDDAGNYIADDDMAFSMVRKYNLPIQYLKFGEVNTIAIRVYDKYIDGGVYEGPIGIIKQEAYTDFWRNWWR